MADTLTITDNRTGKQYEIPVTDGTIRAMDLRQIKVDPDDFGLMSNDPAFLNTASCRSAITFINGEKGILRYRGIPIEELADRSSFLEVAYLLILGRLPNREELEKFSTSIRRHTMIHEDFKRFLGALPKRLPWSGSGSCCWSSRALRVATSSGVRAFSMTR